MTLKEKFIDAFKSGKRFDIQNAEKIADEFAIEFAEWLVIIYNEDIIYDEYTTKELLEIYKTEKGL
jgi:hypothetical protein